jgi:hypothetical protein
MILGTSTSSAQTASHTWEASGCSLLKATLLQSKAALNNLDESIRTATVKSFKGFEQNPVMGQQRDCCDPRAYDKRLVRFVLSIIHKHHQAFQRQQAAIPRKSRPLSYSLEFRQTLGSKCTFVRWGSRLSQHLNPSHTSCCLYRVNYL